MYLTSTQIDWADHTAPTAVQNVRVDHVGRNIRVTEQLLHRPHVVTGFKQMCGKAVSQCVAADALAHATRLCGPANCFLKTGLVQMMAPDLCGARIG